jgi:magnesium-protoporphyrin IX monomethyl ester (oxidative) cyclase
MTLDLDHPKFRAGLERLRRINDANERAREAGGVINRIKRVGFSIAAAVGFARLYLVPTVPNELPDSARAQPVW